MEPLRILEGHEALDWEYDDEADVLYISVGSPRPAVTLDLGVEGVPEIPVPLAVQPRR